MNLESNYNVMNGFILFVFTVDLCSTFVLALYHM